MKILIVNTSDKRGGAARAAYRLHNGLLTNDIDSKMLVQSKISDDFTVKSPETKTQIFLSKLRPTLDSLPVRFYSDRAKAPFSPSWLPFSGIADKINRINPDIVHLHWIGNGMLKIEDIAKIKAPIVWSLHDMWAFTGGCHYDEECGRYVGQCGCCPALSSEKENDLSRKVWKRKEKSFSQKENITIVGLSKWLQKSAKKSSLLENKKVVNLPNPIDTNKFKPFDKQKARELWNLPQDKKLVLFGAMNSTSNHRKGFKELSEAFNFLTKGEKEFVVFGSSKPQNSPEFGFKTHYLGNLNDDVSLITLYNAVDVMVVPSLQENLSNTIMESLACGTPVVSFDIGGNSDMIEHKKNGYLAKPFNSEDLAHGIRWILENKGNNNLCENSRKKILKEFDSQAVTEEYIKLYIEILNSKNPRP